MSENIDIAKEVSSLKIKVQELSDKEAIRDLLAKYGLAFDLGRYDVFFSLWTDDAVFRTDGPSGEIRMEGKEGMKSIFGSEQKVYTASQHLQLKYTIKVTGDTAEAIGYQTITIHTGERPVLDRTGIRRFIFKKTQGRWKIKEAVSRTMQNREGCLSLVAEDW